MDGGIPAGGCQALRPQIRGLGSGVVHAAASSSPEQQEPEAATLETARVGAAPERDYGGTLSRSEEIRIMRALYQCETYHHLFVRQKYKVVFNKVMADLHHKPPRFKQPNGVTNPTGSLDLDGERENTALPQARPLQCTGGSPMQLVRPMARLGMCTCQFRFHIIGTASSGPWDANYGTAGEDGAKLPATVYRSGYTTANGRGFWPLYSANEIGARNE